MNYAHFIRCLLPTKSTSIKEKSNRLEIHRLSVTVCIHELFQLGAAFNSKEHFISILHQKQCWFIQTYHEKICGKRIFWDKRSDISRYMQSKFLILLQLLLQLNLYLSIRTKKNQKIETLSIVDLSQRIAK